MFKTPKNRDLNSSIRKSKPMRGILKIGNTDQRKTMMFLK